MLGKEQRQKALYSLWQRSVIPTFSKGNYSAQLYVSVCKCIMILCFPSGSIGTKFEDPRSYRVSHGFDKSSLLFLNVRQW